MNARRSWKLAGLLSAGALIGLLVPAAWSQLVAKRDLPLSAAIAERAKVDEKDVLKMLEVLGPIVRDKLASGQTIDIPGLGAFRVVRVPGHKDLVDGRPASLTEFNTVEFLPEGQIVEAASAKGAVPAVTVPVFEYNPIPGQTPGQKAPNTRAPNVRSR